MSQLRRFTIIGFTAAILFLSFEEDATKAANPIADEPFSQEYHERYKLNSKDSNDVRSLAVDSKGAVWAATRAGVYRLDQGQQDWIAVSEFGPAFDIATDPEGIVWVAGWNGLYHAAGDELKQLPGIEAPIASLCTLGEKLVCFGPNGDWVVQNGKAVPVKIAATKAIRSAIPNKDGGLWLATHMGLYQQTSPAASSDYWNRDQLLSADVRDVAYATDGSLWVGGLGGVTVFDGAKLKEKFDGAVLSSIDVRCLELGPDGRMWIGTSLGVMRYDGNTWSLRHSKRWLESDDVRDIVFDDDGTAWIATDQGVSAIKTKQITLAEKADHFDQICQARHVRPPGLVEKCFLRTPGDVTTWEPYDDDNDGQYTSMYLAMESYRYAVTKSPQAKANAKRAFEALRFLQTVTETPGFVARTVIPSSWTKMKDPNHEFTDAELAERRVRDPRFKYVPVRWHRSADGKWLWKGDTSSDEITGHYYGYLFYYDLVADEAEKQHVAEHVSNVTDYLIEGGFVLRGMDGKATRWGVWSPERLNHDPNWAMDRNVNSLEMLSYLKATHHMTGDEKYQQHYLDLIDNHGYAENARQSKSMGPAWRTHIDDELMALAYPALLQYETDPKLKQMYLESFDRWYVATSEDRAPFPHFLYAGLSGKPPEMDESITFLKDASLDLIRWRMDNSGREDVQVTHFPEMEMDQTSRLLPISEINFTRWDRNPWQAVQGDGGHTESDGVFWMLPYWMGRYYGYIAGN